APPAPAAGRPPGPDLSRYAAGGTGAPPQPMAYAPAAPPPPANSWEAVRPVARLAALGPVGVAVHGRLQELQPALSECFDRPAAARGVRSAPGAGEGAEGAGPTVLMLELEEGPDRVRIAGAPVATRGDAPEGVVACAQHVLEGETVPVPGARGGARHRVPHALIP
ncbi:MAG TPA: hypothetical protein VLD85_13770, partial [Anaeromyxobacteraceae bacterium]|nr:hypothetical protein [Anaeromyxobacteraceae bacterium]